MAGLIIVPKLFEATSAAAAFAIAGLLGCAWAAGSAAFMWAAWQQGGRPTAQAPAQGKKANTAAPGGDAGASGAAAGAAAAGANGSVRRWQLPAPMLRQVLVLCIAHGVIGCGFFLFSSWIPSYVASLGQQSLASTGRLSSLPWLAAALTGVVAASIADRYELQQSLWVAGVSP